MICRRVNSVKRYHSHAGVVGACRTMGRTAIAACGTVLLLALPACTSNPSVPHTTSSSSPVRAGSQLKDPLDTLTDKKAEFYVGENAAPTLHKTGSGLESFDVVRPESFVTALKFFVTCDPSSEFKISLGTSFYAGPCASTLLNYGSFPIPPDLGAMSVTVDVPEGVHFWIVAIPIR